MKQLHCSPSITPGKENILQEGHCVRNRWQIIKKIGQGAFGEVYHCRDKKDDTEVAIKIVSKEKDTSNPNANAAIQILKLEVSVIRALQGQGFFPRFKAFGKTMRFDYLAMELLGPSLSELRRAQPHRKFSLSTTLRLGEMMLRCIQAIHKAGYVHRDVKPSNFVMGIGKNSRKVYLLDFGLSRQYRLENGELRPARPKASFQGTPRYASINVLNNREAGRQDDLMSLFYVLSEFTFQELPWKNFREIADVAYAKENFDHYLLVSDFPDEFHDYFGHISDLTYEDEPDYDFLLSLFDRSLKRRGVKDTDPLDFEADELTPVVKLQEEENPHSARTQSDVHVVRSELDNPVIPEERLDNMNNQITKPHKVGGSSVLEENSEKKISKNITNISINSNNVYSSCKDTGFSISPNGNQTFASVNTDIESPVSNDPKNKLLYHPIAEPRKAISSPTNESFDSLLKESATIGRKTTDNGQQTVKPVPQLAPQVIKQINLVIPEQGSNGIKPEKRRHSVRRSVSQPSRTRANLKVVQHFQDAPTGLFNLSKAERGLLPRYWSCPTFSLFIRSDLKPPLKQQASFEERIYEVDVMRNVAASKKAFEDIAHSETTRRNSLPSILDSKMPIGHFASEQELTRKDADIYDGTGVGNNRDAIYVRERRNRSSLGFTKVTKSLSDSNVVGYRKSKLLQNSRPLTPVDSKRLNQLMSDDRSETHVSPNYSLCKSPTFKNYGESKIVNDKINQQVSNEQEKSPITNNSTFKDNPKEVKHYEETDNLCKTNGPSKMLENSEKNKIPTNTDRKLHIDNEEISLQKENYREHVVNDLDKKNMTSEPSPEFLQGKSENTRRKSEGTTSKLPQTKDKDVLATTNSTETHIPLQIKDQDRQERCIESSNGFETNTLHSLKKQKSRLSIPEVVISNASDISLSSSSYKSAQGNKLESEENSASQKLSCTDEVEQLPLSKELNSQASTNSEKDLQTYSNNSEVRGNCKVSSGKSSPEVKTNILHSSERPNTKITVPEVVSNNLSESSSSENKVDFSEKGSSKNVSEAEKSSLKSREAFAPHVIHSHNTGLNEENNSSFPKSEGEKMPLSKQSVELDLNKSNGTFNSFQKNPDKITDDHKICANSLDPTQKISISAEKINNGVKYESMQSTTSWTAVNSPVSENSVSQSNVLLDSSSEKVNNPPENKHLPTETVFNSHTSNNSKETINSLQNNLCPQLPDGKQHADLILKNTLKTENSNRSVKEKPNESISNASTSETKESLRNKSPKENVSEQISNLSNSELSNKLSRSKSVNSTLSKEKKASDEFNKIGGSSMNKDSMVADVTESDKKRTSTNFSVLSITKRSSDLLQEKNSDTNVPKDASETVGTVMKSKSKSIIDSAEQQIFRRERQNSDGKLSLNEKHLNQETSNDSIGPDNVTSKPERSIFKSKSRNMFESTEENTSPGDNRRQRGSSIKSSDLPQETSSGAIVLENKSPETLNITKSKSKSAIESTEEDTASHYNRRQRVNSTKAPDILQETSIDSSVSKNKTSEIHTISKSEQTREIETTEKEAIPPNSRGQQSSNSPQLNSIGTPVPDNIPSETHTISKSESTSAIESTEEDATPRNGRRQRQNSDNKYAKDEKDLNLNFTRRRHRPVSQIFEETQELTTYPSSSIIHSPSESSMSDLMQPPPGDPPPNHCLPSRRMRYRQSMNSS